MTMSSLQRAEAAEHALSEELDRQVREVGDLHLGRARPEGADGPAAGQAAS